jgi:hypothetical protein
MSKAWMCLMIAVTSLVMVPGCGRKSADARKYNNDLAAITRELDGLAKSRENDITNNASDVPKLKEIHADLVVKADAIFKRGRALNAPDSTEALALQYAFLRYLDVEEDIIRNGLAKMIELVASQDRAGLQPLLEGMQKRERESLDAFKKAQEDLAKANNAKMQ